MTINEMIKALEELANKGYGDRMVINEEADNISSVFEDGKDNYGNDAVVLYF